ncbi:hypothetical protein BDR03DRAFT_949625 [Suillus americanus]|nr:hypothetical protein BDR03DRAFT_949625 [Suillus americanus]
MTRRRTKLMLLRLWRLSGVIFKDSWGAFCCSPAPQLSVCCPYDGQSDPSWDVYQTCPKLSMNSTSSRGPLHRSIPRYQRA